MNRTIQPAYQSVVDESVLRKIGSRDSMLTLGLLLSVKVMGRVSRNLGIDFTMLRMVTFALRRIGIPLRLLPSIQQRKNEIIRLLLYLKNRMRVYAALEIGTGGGGTFILLSKVAEPGAILITLDLMNDWLRALFFQRLSRAGQHVHVLKGDSRDPCVLRQVGKILAKQRLDLLFIDGDHSYAGVKRDFGLYMRFVRKGGWVVFHDIINDYRTRSGLSRPSYAGEVPRFWNDIKDRYNHFEIVEDYRQDGYGIGVIEV